MKPQLQQNRTNQTVPTLNLPSGLSISTPVYLQLTNQQKKALLNAWRTLNTKQLIELGYETTRSIGELSVTTAETPPQTELERLSGCNEESLRLMLFSRQGIAERLVIKICRLVDLELFTREDIAQTLDLWLNYLYNDEESGTVRSSKTTAKRTKAKEKAA